MAAPAARLLENREESSRAIRSSPSRHFAIWHVHSHTKESPAQEACEESPKEEERYRPRVLLFERQGSDSHIAKATAASSSSTVPADSRRRYPLIHLSPAALQREAVVTWQREANSCNPFRPAHGPRPNIFVYPGRPRCPQRYHYFGK